MTEKGFTIIEILMVITIISVLVGIATYMSGGFFRSNSFNSDVNVLGVYLQRARNQAISNVDESQHGVKINGDEYVLFETKSGKNFSDPSRDTSNDQTIDGNPNFTYTPVDAEVIFDQLSGNLADTSYVGNIIISDGFKTATISLNSIGRISF